MRCASVVCALLVLLSGCTALGTTGPKADQSALDTQTPSPESNTLLVNESRVYDRVASLLDSNVSQPSLEIVDATRLGASQYRLQEPFSRVLLGVNDTTFHPAAYYNPDAHKVVVVRPDGRPANATNESQLKLTLAHEYAHAITLTENRYRQAMTNSVVGDTTDTLQIRRAMREGTAVYVSEVYADRYLENTSEVRQLSREYRRSRPLLRYVLGPYVFGARYFNQTLDSPANLPEAYRHPPKTTEQLIHAYNGSAELPTPLNVTVETGNGSATGERDTLGELFTRSMLGGHLNESRAAHAAAGWGNDNLVTVWNYDANESNQRTYVWTIRWDDRRNATEFTRAFEEYMDRRGHSVGERTWDTGDRQFRLERVSDETVVVFIGGTNAVNRLSVSGTNTNVTVTG